MPGSASKRSTSSTASGTREGSASRRAQRRRSASSTATILPMTLVVVVPGDQQGLAGEDQFPFGQGRFVVVPRGRQIAEEVDAGGGALGVHVRGHVVDEVVLRL